MTTRFGGEELAERMAEVDPAVERDDLTPRELPPDHVDDRAVVERLDLPGEQPLAGGRQVVRLREVEQLLQLERGHVGLDPGSVGAHEERRSRQRVDVVRELDVLSGDHACHAFLIEQGYRPSKSASGQKRMAPDGARTDTS